MPLWDCGVDSLGGRENVEAGMKKECVRSHSLGAVSHPNATKLGDIA